MGELGTLKPSGLYAVLKVIVPENVPLLAATLDEDEIARLKVPHAITFVAVPCD